MRAGCLLPGVVFVCCLIGPSGSQVSWRRNCCHLALCQTCPHQRTSAWDTCRVSICISQEYRYSRKAVLSAPCILHPLDIILMCLARAFLYKGLTARFLASACRSGGCDRCLRSVKAVGFRLSQSVRGDHDLGCAAHVILLPVVAVTDTTSDSTVHLITLPFQVIGRTNACPGLCRYRCGSAY